MVAVIVILVVVIVLVLAVVGLYNGMVQKRNRVDNAWQTIDANLQRRADLIPNLVESVKGYAAHEKDTLEELTKARSAVTSAKTPEAAAAANNMLESALTHLFAVAEAYPDLKANTTFIDLQQQLADAENRIVYARQSYNDTVLMYNNAIQTFPGNIIAGMFHFESRTGFEVTDEANRQAPSVKF